MTDSLNGPGVMERLTRLVRRVDDLERRLRARSAAKPPAAEPLEGIFSLAGALTTVASGRWYPRRTGTLTNVFASLDTAGSSSTVVTVYVDGASQGTITLGSGVNKSSVTFDDVLVADTDYLTVAVTTVGTGAANLTVQARLA